MKRLFICWRTITRCKINAYMQSHFASSKNVIKEWFFLFDINVSNYHWIFFVITLNFQRHIVFASCRKVSIICFTNTCLLMLSSWIKSVDLESNQIFVIWFGQGISISEYSVPLKFGTFSNLLLSTFTFKNCFETIGLSFWNCKE